MNTKKMIQTIKESNPMYDFTYRRIGVREYLRTKDRANCVTLKLDKALTIKNVRNYCLHYVTGLRLADVYYVKSRNNILRVTRYDKTTTLMEA